MIRNPFATMGKAATDIITERWRQIAEEGWSPEHDDTHVMSELANAAACYAFGEIIETQTGECLWPWDERWWKPGETRSNLVKAGALILAEIERIDRVEGSQHE